MEVVGGSFWSRVSERALGWVALGLIVLAGVGLWQMGPEGRGALWSATWRSAAWLAIAAVVPWIASLFIERLLELRTNWAGAALVAVLVAFDALAGILLLSDWPASGWAWVAAIGVLGVAGTYNFLVAEYLAQRAGH